MIQVNPANAIKAYSGTARAAVPDATGLGGNSNSVAPQEFFGFGRKWTKGLLLKAVRLRRLKALKPSRVKSRLAMWLRQLLMPSLLYKTVVAVRDKVVNAYQEIMRMPI